MTITEYGYEPDSEDEIYERLKNQFEDQFSTTVVPGTVVDALLRSEAAVLAKNQEQALEKVWSSAYLSTAEGEELGNLVETIGLERREAIPATGVVRVGRELPPVNNHVIPGGTVVQTGGAEPVEFETTESGAFKFIDGFEDESLSEWMGDITNATIQSTVSLKDSYSLELPATSGISIYRDDLDLGIGTTIGQHIQLGTDGIYGFRFGRQDSDNYYEVEVNAYTSELTINIVEGGSVVDSQTSSVTIPTDESHYLEIEWNVQGEIEASLFTSETRESLINSVELTDPSMRFRDGGIELASLGATSTKYVDNLTTRQVTVNAESLDPGVVSNVAPNTINVFQSRPSGVEYVNNDLPTGDLTYDDTDGVALIRGRDRENDDELRERAYDSTSIGGAATVNALDTELTRIDSVSSVKIFQNKTNVDNVDSGGLPPKSFEVALHGGKDDEIAEAIFSTKAVDSHDYGGAHGTEKTYTISSDVLSDSETISWTQIPEIDLNITLDLVIDKNYVGDEAIQSIVAQYVGGTDIDGGELNGLSVGDDLYVGVLRDKVIGPSDTGVYDISSYTIDRDGDGVDDTTTSVSGATVLSIADSEVAITNARDGSITVNTTEI